MYFIHTLPRRMTLALVVVLLALQLAACGTTTSTNQMPPTEPTKAGSQSITIENCGFTTTYTQVPSRILSTNQPTTDILLKLGLESHIAGILYGELYVPEPEFDYAKLNNLGGNMVEPVSKEKIIELRPDFVFSANPNGDFDPTYGMPRDQFAEMGANIYGMSQECSHDTTQMKVTSLYDDILNTTEVSIVWMFRLPRTLLAGVVGAALAVSGAVLQALVRNPLADPYVFGVSSGASVGAVALLTLGPIGLVGISFQAAAFVGALVAMILVYLMAQRGGQVAPMRLLLAGIAIGYTLQAVTSYLVLRSSRPGGGVTGVLTWLAGSLGNAKWNDLGIPTLLLFVITFLLIIQARPLNALLTGEESATGLGVDLARFRLQLFVLTSLLVGTAVSVSGAIGFVGLMLPHLARFFVGANHHRLLPLVAVGGAIYLMLADIIGRTMIAPAELPVGIVTAALGGPFFLWMLMQRNQALR